MERRLQSRAPTVSEQAGFRYRISRAWAALSSRVAGFFASRAEAVRTFAAGREAIERAATVVALADQAADEADRRIAELVKEVRQLAGEKASLEAVVTLREKEITELTLCLERNRIRVEAEIALEAARMKAGGSASGG